MNDNLRHMDCRRKPARRTGRPAAAVLAVEDFPRLKASPKLFARKFDATVDASVLDAIDREILQTV